MDNDLTLKDAQKFHPWNVLNDGYGAVPYSSGIREVERGYMPHIQGTHAVLHAAKSVGKLAAVFEAADHSGEDIDHDQRTQIAAMSADLLTAALRLAWLYDFDLAEALNLRAIDKNGVGVTELRDRGGR